MQPLQSNSGRYYRSQVLELADLGRHEAMPYCTRVEASIQEAKVHFDSGIAAFKFHNRSTFKFFVNTSFWTVIILSKTKS